MDINKEKFCKLIDAMQEQVDADEAFGDCISVYSGQPITMRGNNALIMAITDYLDNETGCCKYIYAYIFETNFGRNATPRTEMAHELKGVDTSEKLYDFLLLKTHKQ